MRSAYRVKTTWAVLIVALATTLTVAAAVPHTPRADFDHNGCGDLAIGAPYKDLGLAVVEEDAGMVVVLYGDPAPQGLSADGAQIWHQGMGVLSDYYEADDAFGHALAAGDLNGDGSVDMVVGVAHEQVGTAWRGGAIHVVYGRPGGLASLGDQLWHQGSPGIDGAVETLDEFGSSLAIGDFNGDRYADVAIGVPGEDLEGIADSAGAVNVLYGSAEGLTATGNQLWTRESAGVLGSAQELDVFGRALAAGDFDGDGVTDLAIGVPNDDLASPERTEAGTIQILYGGSSGLHAIDNMIFSLDDVSGSGGGAATDHFGTSLTSGDFDADGYEDLAVGISDREVDSVVCAGAVAVFYGAPVGLTAVGSQYWHQNSTNIFGTAETFDYFGDALESGDFDGDGYDDLVVGVPLENYGDIGDAGAVHILYGSALGVSSRNQVWYQNSPGIDGELESGDRFGSAVAAGDFNCDSYVDLAIGAPLEMLGGLDQVGVVHVIHGSSTGLVGTGGQTWDQTMIDGLTPVARDGFGSSLANAYSPFLFVDGFEAGTTDSWSDAVP